ncbi:MAG TPA: DUF4331 domain-containing protein [Thermoanaerobaculia bacterium]|nr:DUF4331 domain-containing protein [Thermoanaerobaculia bacterium]
MRYETVSRRVTPAILVVLGLTLTPATPARASSHREAPFVTETPAVDGTDFYMFRSYEPGRDGFVTLVATYLPLQDPYGGPNYFALDPDAFYDIHVENDGDGVEDLTFRFRFGHTLRGFALPVGDEVVPVPLVNVGQVLGGVGRDSLNRLQTYTVRLIRGSVDAPEGIGFLEKAGGGPLAQRFVKPEDNTGAKTFPDYEAYARQFVYDVEIPGCGAGRVFAGQRKDPFVVNLGEIFDLVNIANPVGPRDAETDDLADKNVTALALEVPIGCLTGEAGPVIGGWTTARLPRIRELSDDPSFEAPAVESGDLVQVSRLGMPLVNEVVIGLPDKNRFNASRPDGDGRFATYVTNPTLPELLELLFGTPAPNNFPRQDLVAAFVTGVPGLNELGFGEMQRLNTSIPPTPAGEQSDLGVLGGDAAGFPNGRRPGDDVVDVELRVAMGLLCHAFPGVFGCGPQDAPAGNIPFTDGAIVDASFFDQSFPYLTTPLAGSPR